MTRKDYIQIAEALRYAHQNFIPAHKDDNFGAFSRGVLQAAQCVSDSLAKANLRFNSEHFLAVVRGEKSLTSRPGRKS